MRGELDLVTVATLSTELETAIRAGEAVAIALDECTFLDSSALKAITDANRAAGAAGTAFVLERPSEQVARVLEMSGIDTVVTIQGG